MAAVATSAGSGMRNRMMHYAADESFNCYLATMKSDPKAVQITHHSSVSLLIYKGGSDVNDSQEVEISGKAVIVKDQEERQKALEITAKRSPVVRYLVEAGNDQVLACIKVVPDVAKFRILRKSCRACRPQ